MRISESQLRKMVKTLSEQVQGTYTDPADAENPWNAIVEQLSSFFSSMRNSDADWDADAKSHVRRELLRMIDAELSK